MYNREQIAKGLDLLKHWYEGWNVNDLAEDQLFECIEKANLGNKKFSQLAINEPFLLLGERMVKVSPLSYRSIDNPIYGEQFAGPITDQQIDVEPTSGATVKAQVIANPEVTAVKEAVANPPELSVKRKRGRPRKAQNG